MKCSKCGKSFTGSPATSRIDNSFICSLCGNKEALDAAVQAGIMTNEMADEIIQKLKQLENN